MILKDFITKCGFKIINDGNNGDTKISKVFCCDLLSIAMSKNPSDSVWITVMGNINAVAVCTLTEGACIVLAENIQPDAAMLEKANQQGVTILATELPVFDAGLIAHNIING